MVTENEKPTIKESSLINHQIKIDDEKVIYISNLAP